MITLATVIDTQAQLSDELPAIDQNYAGLEEGTIRRLV
jgi:hypothetical protein